MDPQQRLQRHVEAGVVSLVLPEPSFAMVRFVISTRMGAMLDPKEMSGAMRLMVEMLLRGTRDKSRHAFHRALEELGAQVDVSVGHEMAMCRGLTLRRHLPRVWELVTEALTQPAFDAEEVERLKVECLDELQCERDDDDAVAEIFLRRALYGTHRLGERAGGTMRHIHQLDVAAVRAAYQRFCRQDLVIGWAGDITPEAAQRYSASLQSARRPLAQQAADPSGSATVAAVPPLTTPRILLVDKPDRTQVQLRLAALGPLPPHPQCEAVWLAVLAFGGTFTSPFTREVRDERGWSYVAHADYRRLARLAAPVVLRCAPAMADAADCLALCIRLYGDLANGRLPDSLVDGARRYILNRYPFEVATAFDILGSAMAQELCGLPPAHLFGLPERLAAMPAGAPAAALPQHLSEAGYVGVAVAPQQQLLPVLRQRLGDAVRVDVVDFRDGLQDS